jgi:lipid II:glycine glycyltransferase (peptidoglycan interpeptide bridge formation enzyme)
LEVALSLLFREFDQLIPNNFFNNSTLEYRYSEYFDDKGVTSFGKKCIELSSVVLPVFEQYVPLNGELTSIESCFSKSVKTAIKDSIKRDLRVNIYNSDSNQSDSLIAFGELRRLHFESAQRSTRSNSTWDIQYNLILQDESFLITISDASEVLGAALFYNNKATAYYAVSARKSEIKFSVSHALIYEGIKYSKKIGLKRLYMGTQFSNKIGDSNKKIDSIENFKSFFGGVYIYGFLAKR